MQWGCGVGTWALATDEEKAVRARKRGASALGGGGGERCRRVVDWRVRMRGAVEREDVA